MRFKQFKAASLIFLAAVLAACGGGGGSGNDSGFNPPAARATATASQTSIPAASSTDISVRITEGSGAAVRDGVVVTGSVSPASVGRVFGLTAAGALTSESTATTVGGNANFRFVGASPGTATVTFSAQDPNTTGRIITTSVTVNVTPGLPRLSIEATRTTLPVNAANVPIFWGTPYMAEVTITVRDQFGNLVNKENGVTVAVNPVGQTGGYSTLDDPETEENEFFIRMGAGPVDVIAGKATIFLHSLNFAGTTTLTVTYDSCVCDGGDGNVYTASQVFTIASGQGPMPAEVNIAGPRQPVYVATSGGNSNGQFELRVVDAIGQSVPDPVAGNVAWNNVRIEIVGDDLGARLSGVNAAGQTVTGNAISVRTFNGIGSVTVFGATRPGLLQFRVSADRADNNVDNGLQEAIHATASVVIGDGVLFDVQLTTPRVNVLFVNPTGDDVETGIIEIDEDNELEIPLQPDGTYSRTISVIATDRLGNPVLPGTVINFGLIDEPQVSGISDFVVRGNDGRPQVGATHFTAPSGSFSGIGPGDTLVVFGKRESGLPFGLTPPPHGYRDLESARQVSQVLSQNSLNVTRRFNHNDDTGVSLPVPVGGLLPYVIGRATDGNIVATATTNELGVATTLMTYPVSRLGKYVVIWAQGNGDVVAGSPETVTDAEVAFFAGLAPARTFAIPGNIPANTTADVTVCVVDALRMGLANVGISGEFVNLDGQGSIQFLGGGPLPHLTGDDGCVIARVTTSGVLQGNPSVHFFGAGPPAVVNIVRGTLVLQARPTLMFGSGTITLRLISATGQPLSGYQLVGSCEAAAPTMLTITEGPGTTNASGETTVSVTAFELNRAGSAGSGTCTFSTADGSATATVQFQGIDMCTINLSPPHPDCP
jgi:hypothetical protein